MAKKIKKTVVMPTEVVVNTDGTTEMLSMKPSADILDMKLTRTELIELIVSEVETDLKSQLKTAGDEWEKLQKEIRDYYNTISDDDFINTYIMPSIRESLKANRKRCGVGCGNKYSGYIHTNFEVDIPAEFSVRNVGLTKQIKDLETKLRSLHSKEGKNTIMKQMLGASEAGKNLLEQIKGFNKGLATKLLK